MKRPRIALCIVRQHTYAVPELGGAVPGLFVPRWLWLWAVRRVDRWHLREDIQANLPVEDDKPLIGLDDRREP